MKYTVINQLTDINLHDAEINRIFFEDDQIIWDLAVVQAPVMYIPQKKLTDDICYLKGALMIFENAHIEIIEIGGHQVYDKNRNLIEWKESVILSPNEYVDFLKNISFERGSYIYGIKELYVTNDDQYRVSFAVSGCDITIKYTKSIIKWDEFAGKEWRRKLRDRLWLTDR